MSEWNKEMALVLSAADFAAFMAILEHPPKPPPKLKALMAKPAPWDMTPNQGQGRMG